VDFENGLNSAVNRLREAFCDSAKTPKYIETVPSPGRSIAFADKTRAESGKPIRALSPVQKAFGGNTFSKIQRPTPGEGAFCRAYTPPRQ